MENRDYLKHTLITNKTPCSVTTLSIIQLIKNKQRHREVKGEAFALTCVHSCRQCAFCGHSSVPTGQKIKKKCAAAVLLFQYIALPKGSAASHFYDKLSYKTQIRLCRCLLCLTQCWDLILHSSLFYTIKIKCVCTFACAHTQSLTSRMTGLCVLCYLGYMLLLIHRLDVGNWDCTVAPKAK